MRLSFSCCIAETTVQNIVDFFDGKTIANEVCYHCTELDQCREKRRKIVFKAVLYVCKPIRAVLAAGQLYAFMNGVNALSHKYYYRIIDAAWKNDIPVRYFGSASAKKCAVQLALDERAAEKKQGV